MKKEKPFRWRLPADYLFKMIPALIFMQKRNFRQDSIEILKSSRIQIDISGKSNIAKDGPVLFLVNHYSAPGFNALWMAISITAICPQNITWTMTDAWTFPNRRFRKIARALSHILLTRISKVYGFFTFQPISPEPINIMEQALSVRRILHFARDHPKSMLCIAPEGRDSLDGKLGNPPKGAGLLIKAFTDLQYHLIPVGFSATPGICHLNYGEPIYANIRNSLSKEEIDLQISKTVMKSIAELLPEKFRNHETKEHS
jgi:1-acyl-sn-glycerol-3-phosphate acyltransferase